MTDLESWLLREALDELLARDGWQEDHSSVYAMERRIAVETGVGSTHAEIWNQNDMKAAEAMRRGSYLRSLDAAALLERAIAHAGFTCIRGGPDRAIRVDWQIFVDLKPQQFYVIASTEAAARTRAALEGGWRLGLWPVK